MPSVVVDTDVVSFLFKGDSRADLYRPHLAGNVLVVSFMTIAELEFWAMRYNWGQARRSRLEQYLLRFTMYPVHRTLCRSWAQITDEARRQGRPIRPTDAWIAATALVQGIPLVTHNRRDYAAQSGLRLISEAPV